MWGENSGFRPRGPFESLLSSSFVLLRCINLPKTALASTLTSAFVECKCFAQLMYGNFFFFFLFFFLDILVELNKLHCVAEVCFNFKKKLLQKEFLRICGHGERN